MEVTKVRLLVAKTRGEEEDEKKVLQTRGRGDGMNFLPPIIYRSARLEQLQRIRSNRILLARKQ